MFRYIGGKYCWFLMKTIIRQTNIYGHNISHKYFSLDEYGLLTVYSGYSWNGMSTVPKRLQINVLFGGVRGSLFHDVLYQAIQLNLLDHKYRINADDILLNVWVEDGVNEKLALFGYSLVRIFGRFYVKK